MAATRDKEKDRYRRAAEDALQQLDWCIGYLHGIRNVRISRALAQPKLHPDQGVGAPRGTAADCSDFPGVAVSLAGDQHVLPFVERRTSSQLLERPSVVLSG